MESHPHLHREQHVLDYTLFVTHTTLLLCAAMVGTFTEYKNTIYHHKRSVALWTASALMGYASTVFMLFPILPGSIGVCAKDGHHLHVQTAVVLFCTLFMLVAYWTQLLLFFIPAYTWRPLSLWMVHALLTMLLWFMHMSILCQTTSTMVVLLGSPLVVGALTVLALRRLPPGEAQHYDDIQLKHEMAVGGRSVLAMVVAVYVWDGVAFFVPALRPTTALVGRGVWLSLNLLPPALHLLWPSVRSVWLYRKRTRSTRATSRARYTGIDNLTAAMEEDALGLYAITDDDDDTGLKSTPPPAVDDAEMGERGEQPVVHFLAHYMVDEPTTAFLQGVDLYAAQHSQEAADEHTAMLMVRVECAPPDTVLGEAITARGLYLVSGDDNAPCHPKEYIVALYNDILAQLQERIETSMKESRLL